MPPLSSSAHDRSRGSSVFEFVLVLPAAALVIVMLIGSAQTLLLRQYALIAARQAAFYQRVTGCQASATMIGQNIPAGDSPWQVGQGTQPGSGNQLPFSGGGGILGVVEGFIANAVGAFSVHASNTPRRGYIARSFQISDASANYSLIQGYWTNNDCSVMMAALSGLLNALGSILNITSPQPGGGC
jgi:hypothetical protein